MHSWAGPSAGSESTAVSTAPLAVASCVCRARATYVTTARGCLGAFAPRQKRVFAFGRPVCRSSRHRALELRLAHAELCCKFKTHTGFRRLE